MGEMIKMAIGSEDEISLKGTFFQTLSRMAIKFVIQKGLKDAIGPNSNIVVERLNMKHVDGSPVKIQLEISGELAEVDLLNLVSKLK